MNRKLAERICNAVYWIAIASILYIAFRIAVYALRIVVADQFVIPTQSMMPTLQPGDRVMVNKLLMGGRIYRSLDFKPEGQPLESFRLKGLRRLRHNDVAVFNYPVFSDTIAFKINYVYCKRIVGMPGDTLSIVKGRYRSTGHDGPLGDVDKQDEVGKLPPDGGGYPGFACNLDGSGWTIRDFGPYYIPRKGDVAQVDSAFAALYRRILRYETGKEVTWDSISGCAMAGGEPLRTVVFAHNYYFMAGDNAPDSCDSRYWGLVPEEHIVGVVDLITYSKDRRTDKFNTHRIMKWL